MGVALSYSHRECGHKFAVCAPLSLVSCKHVQHRMCPQERLTGETNASLKQTGHSGASAMFHGNLKTKFNDHHYCVVILLLFPYNNLSFHQLAPWHSLLILHFLLCLNFCILSMFTPPGTNNFTINLD